ncbi:MAG TPA: tripartite tricarboxylate transporter substrate-binding protein, partial [Burkholderiales bacterium]|nr:tripartite tricarboxylate transporter substrate-binding protein [Burkholderiales bacterium]
MIYRLLCLLMTIGVTVASVPVADAQSFPTRPIRIVVPTSPGGLLDTVIRPLGQKVNEGLGQPLVIENRPGASNNIGTELVARSRGDGYTLLGCTLPFVVNPSLFSKLGYEVEKDFQPIALLVSSAYVISVHPSVPVKSIKDLVALAKSKPGAINYSSGGNGTNLHIAAELLMNLTGMQMTHLAYRGGGPALMAIVSGEADLSIPSVAAVVPQMNAGRIRAIAVTSTKRSALLPQVPTVAESGVPNYEFASWIGILAPAGTPSPVVGLLNKHIVSA